MVLAFYSIFDIIIANSGILFVKRGKSDER